MNRHSIVSALLISSFACAAFAADGDELARRASWQAPSPAAVKAQVDAWLATLKLDDAQKAAVAARWPADEKGLGELAPEAVLEAVVDSAAAVNAEAAELAAGCRAPLQPGAVPAYAILKDSALPPAIRQNLQLYFGKWLAQNRLYDDAVGALESLEIDLVADPASLLFYQSVAYHHLLAKDKLSPTVAKLMEQESALPKRYALLARLMESDLKPVKTDSLDEVSRLMRDIGRNLDFGRAGTRVRKKEEDVVAKLDKLIEELEEQQKKQQQQQSSAPGSGQNPSQPKPDSVAGGPSGPGKVDPKDIGKRDGWGNLPPKDRQEVLQELSKDLPSHYRDVIEQYFRRLARDNRD